MKGDVVLAKEFMQVTVTAEDRQYEPGAIADYLDDGWRIVSDQREEEDDDDPA